MLPMISGREGDRIKIEVTVDLSGGMLEAEDAILRAVNAVGNVATWTSVKLKLFLLVHQSCVADLFEWEF